VLAKKQLLLKSGSRVQASANFQCAANGRAVAAHSKADATACDAAEVSDMSEAAQAEGGIVIKGNRFDFETCERIILNNLCVRFPSLHDVA